MTSMQILRVAGSSALWDSWDRFVSTHPQGSPFHSKAWQDTIESTFGHEPYHVAAVNPDSNEVLGILPLFLIRSRIFGRLLVSTPQAAYGGPLGQTDLVVMALLEHAIKLAQDCNVQFLEFRSFQNQIDDPSLLTKDLYVTFRQELFHDSEKNFMAIPRKTRAEVREGISHGLEFGINAIGVGEFYQVYSQSVRALGTPVFSKKLFLHGLRKFGDTQCKVFSVHSKGSLAAAVWTLFFRDQVLPYYGGSLKGFNHLSVNNFM